MKPGLLEATTLSIMLSKCHLIFVVTCLLLFEALDAKECNERCAACDDGKCIECIYGWYGHDCKSACQNCWTAGCQRYDGKCHRCKPGRYKDHCREHCPQNCRADRKGDVHCRRKDGKCLDGCKEGWRGDTCNLPCSKHCDGACLQHNGHCIGDCKSGWWGASCEIQCSEGCLSNRCECITGKCKCKAGFTGKQCYKKHIHNCIDPSYYVDDISLVCDNGCKPGYTSPSCSYTCQDNCVRCHQFDQKCELCLPPFYGDNCQAECSQTCQNYSCDSNGKCLRGCSVGLWGEKCDKACPFNCIECQQEGDICTKCKVDWTGKLCEDVISGTDRSRLSLLLLLLCSASILLWSEDC